MAVSDKIMFEIYREADYDRKYRVVYFTELEEHNKDAELARAMAGDHLFDGFIPDRISPEAKRAIDALLDRLNDGMACGQDEVQRQLAEYLATDDA